MTDRTCCLLSALLGNRTMSARLLEAVRAVAPGPVDEVWFSDDTYREHPAPAWARRSSELEAEFVASRLFAARGLPSAATYVVNTVVLAQAARRHRPEARWIVATDATPALTDRMRARAYGDAASLARRAFRRVQGARFRRFARTVDAWLPMSEACGDSLVDDYGVAPARCLTTSAPQRDIDRALPRRDPEARPWRLLFVGNDFVRKGGPQLCAALELLPDTRLTIVSRDPDARRHAAAAAARVDLVAGVSDRAVLARLYRDHHLLVHPTFVDHYSHVICEGLAHGLPFAVTEGTPPAELIARSGAGVAIEWPPSPQSIAAAVLRAMQPAERYAPRCGRALEFAQRELSAETFARRLGALLASGERLPSAGVEPAASRQRTGGVTENR